MKLIGGYMFFFFLCIGCTSTCDQIMLKEKKLNIIGFVENKYIDTFNRFTEIIKVNGASYTLTYYDKAFDNITIYDSVYKDSSTYSFKIIKANGITKTINPVCNGIQYFDTGCRYYMNNY